MTYLEQQQTKYFKCVIVTANGCIFFSFAILSLNYLYIFVILSGFSCAKSGSIPLSLDSLY